MNRGVDQTDIFRDDIDRDEFLRIVADVSVRYGVQVHVYCLMGNHYHLLVCSTEGRISDAMRDLGGRYARWFNRRHHRRGPLFGGRFRSVLIRDDRQLITTWAYIHQNPAELGVQQLTAYPWSSAAAYLNPANKPRWLHTAELTRLIGEGDIAHLLNTA